MTTSQNELLTKSQVATESPDVGSHKDTSRLSSLSLQLSESAARAAARHSNLSRKELGAKANELLSKISGDGYFITKKANDAEVPATQDPVLLAVRTMQRSLSMAVIKIHLRVCRAISSH
ncbi:hypothetical protein [Pseudomonas syringae]|uniref:hypothetical protein n=1 Tax=Pseudomonas syringae TaxID=317 RepID=UPI0020BF9A33|nr:hypothetical protein [Pseudomonas syringae]